MRPVPLEPGERLLWAGRADRWIKFHVEALGAVAGAAVIVLFQAAGMGGGSLELIVFGMVGPVLGIVAIGYLTEPDRFALTDRRALRITRHDTVTDMAYGAICNVRIRFGTITLVSDGATLILGPTREIWHVDRMIRDRMPR